MRYDEFGNPIYDAPEPSLDDMRLALSRQNRLTPQQMERVVAPSSAVSQIPTEGNPKAPQAQRPLEQVTNDLRAMATGMNPLMMMKSMRDMANTLVVNPLLMPASIAIEAAQGKPMRDITGQALYQAPQTPAGQQFAEGLAKTFEAAKVPHMWPLTPRPAGMRPALTPNDVRVMGAEATRLGRQIKDVPTDFANAAAGLTKLDPVTETPTLGARLGQAERGVVETGKRVERALDPIVTDIMERGGSSADLLSAMAGQPMYAIRPKGTTLVTPTRPEPDTTSTYDYPHDAVQYVLSEFLAEPQKTTLAPTQLADVYNSQLARQMNAIAPALSTYVGQRIAAMYPDAPSQDAAESAFYARYADSGATAAKRQELLADFLTQTPEGQASGVPTPAELQNRHAAAVTWLNGPFANYIKRNVGTEGDPLVKLASQGLTFLPDARIREMAADDDSKSALARRRLEAGFPAMGSFTDAIFNKTRELDQLRSEIAELESRRAVLFDVAQSQGLRDPADLPAYAALTRPIQTKARERDKLQEDIDKLSLGRAYEDISDYAVVPKDAGPVQQGLDYAARQFYPTLMQTPGTEKVYLASNRRMLNMGLGDIGNAFYNDVISGAIPLDKVQKTTVENYVRGKARDRVKAEAEAKVKEAAYVANVEKRLQAVLSNVPNDMTFGNAAIIELTDATPMDVVVARMSEDTAVLDHCVGEGGRAGDKAVNPFTGKQQSYTPIIDPLTGQKHSNASKDATGYTRAVRAGSQLISVRSLDTGRPVATLQFEKSHLGQNGQQQYRIGYASGVQNGDIDSAYATAIRDYLNSRADNISSTGENLAAHAGVFDTSDQDDMRQLGRKLSLSQDELRFFDWGALPRFIVADDVRTLLQERQSVAATQPAGPAQQSMRETDQILPATRNAVMTAFHTAGNMLEGRAAQMLQGLWSDIRDQYLPPDATIRDLRATRVRLENAEATYANRGTGDGDAMAEVISEVILPEINDILEQRTQPAQAAVAAQALDVFDIIDEMVTASLNNDGMDVAAPFETVARNIAVRINPNLRTQEYIQALRDAADRAQSERVELALYDLADQIATAQSRRIATELFEMGRDRDGTLNFPDLMNTATVLGMGQLDHPVYRHIPPGTLRADAMRGVLDNFNNMVAAAQRAQQPAPDEAARVAAELMARPQQQPNVAPFRPIAAHASEMTYEQLREAMTPDEQGEVAAVHDDLVRANPTHDDIRTIAQLVHDHQMSAWENFPDTQRAMLYMELLSTANRMEAAPNTPEAARIREEAEAIGDTLAARIREEAEQEGAGAAPMIRNYIRNLDVDSLTDLLGMASNVYDITPQLVAAVRQELEQYLARYEGRAPQRRGQAVVVPQLTEDLRIYADDALEQLDVAPTAEFEDAIDPGEDRASAIREITRLLDELRAGEDEIYGLWHEDGPMAPELRSYFIQRLEQMLDDFNDGNADGGLIRGYKDGGKVSYPPFYKASNQAITRAQEMYPNDQGQDDRVDAARHMLAAGYATQSFGPTIAKGLGYAHELKEAPIRTAGSWLGLSKPRYDYAMDVRNNALGVELAQKAKDRADFERRVQEAIATGRARTLTSEQASKGREALKYANGGKVHTTTDLDKMRLELMMRRK